jgi:maltose/moltooligosaccharide transporter
MGVFNFFIVIPQIVAAAVLGPVVRHLFAGQALPAVVTGGVSLLVAAVALSWVPREPVPAASGGVRGLA